MLFWISLRCPGMKHEALMSRHKALLLAPQNPAAADLQCIHLTFYCSRATVTCIWYIHFLLPTLPFVGRGDPTNCPPSNWKPRGFQAEALVDGKVYLICPLGFQEARWRVHGETHWMWSLLRFKNPHGLTVKGSSTWRAGKGKSLSSMTVSSYNLQPSMWGFSSAMTTRGYYKKWVFLKWQSWSFDPHVTAETQPCQPYILWWKATN